MSRQDRNAAYRKNKKLTHKHLQLQLPNDIHDKFYRVLYNAIESNRLHEDATNADFMDALLSCYSESNCMKTVVDQVQEDVCMKTVVDQEDTATTATRLLSQAGNDPKQARKLLVIELQQQFNVSDQWSPCCTTHKSGTQYYPLQKIYNRIIKKLPLDK